jgi:hypothetical protein
VNRGDPRHAWQGVSGIGHTQILQNHSGAFAENGECAQARNRIASKVHNYFFATNNTKAFKKALCAFVFFVAKKQ